METKNLQLTIDRQRIAISNPDKVMYAAGRFTKAQVIDYYIPISKYLRPHVKRRPVTLKRFASLMVQGYDAQYIRT